MSKTIEGYAKKVDEALAAVTDGVFDLSLLTDYAEGENSISEMFFDGLTPEQAAVRKMFADGFEKALNCWSSECDFCEFELECPHIN